MSIADAICTMAALAFMGTWLIDRRRLERWWHRRRCPICARAVVGYVVGRDAMASGHCR